MPSRKPRLAIAFSPAAWATLGRVSREEFEQLRTELDAATGAIRPAPGGPTSGVLRSGDWLIGYEVDGELRTLTVVTLRELPVRCGPQAQAT